MAKRGRPRKHPIRESAPTMIYECLDRRGKVHTFRMSGELTAKEAMERLGVYQRPFHVVRYTVDKTERKVIQHFES